MSEMSADDDLQFVKSLARKLLELEDEPRLSEVGTNAGLLQWIRRGMARLQDTNPNEPPPAVEFRPETLARDFWSGRKE